MSKTAQETADMVQHNEPNERCRLVLILTGEQLKILGSSAHFLVTAAINGGDVASIIFAQNPLEETQFLELVKPCIEAAQTAGVAAIIAGDSRIAGRTGADGLQIEPDPKTIADAVERFSPKMMIGAGNVRTRHNALSIGEKHPDYLMFGKPGGDTHNEAHPKNLALAEWWAAMVEIPCIVAGGRSLDSVIEASETGAEFVALGSAIFAPDQNGTKVKLGEDAIAERIRRANDLLDQHAPKFDDAEI